MSRIMVWHADLKEEAWNAARSEAGVPIPPVSGLNSASGLPGPPFQSCSRGRSQGDLLVSDGRDLRFGLQVHP